MLLVLNFWEVFILVLNKFSVSFTPLLSPNWRKLLTKLMECLCVTYYNKNIYIVALKKHQHLNGKKFSIPQLWRGKKENKMIQKTIPTFFLFLHFLGNLTDHSHSLFGSHSLSFQTQSPHCFSYTLYLYNSAHIQICHSSLFFIIATALHF